MLPKQALDIAQLDTGEALRAVDMGPPAESPKAAAFREFWGDRAELRRYKVRCSCIPMGPSQRFGALDSGLPAQMSPSLGARHAIPEDCN